MKEQISWIAQIGEIFANPTSVSNEQIEDILLHLCDSEDLAKHFDSPTDIFSSQCKENSFFSDAPMITDNIYAVDSLRQMDIFFKCSTVEFECVIEEIEKEMYMEDIVLELGYGCTVNTAHCKSVLSCFQPLNEVKLCKLLGRIARTYTGLEDTRFIYATFISALNSGLTTDTPVPISWNIDVLIDSIKQLAPETNWTRVMENLDHEVFSIPDASSFSVLMAVYAKACQDPFPLHAVCESVWKNADSQISFLRHAVAAPPEVFTFAHCSRKLTYPESLPLSNVQGNQAWFCLDLLETLCQLAERGHVSSSWSMLEYPISHCPEVLLIGIAQINTSYNLLQYEVSCNVLPSILKDSTNNTVVQFLWHVKPDLLLRGFADAYTDPNSLFRILDICQDLEILSPVLDTSPVSFSMKLAAIASRKEQINLEQWLNKNLNAYKDAFFVECLKFLREVHNDIASNIPRSSLQQSRADVLNAYQETGSIIFKVLQSYYRKLGSPQLLEEFKSLHGLFNQEILSDAATDLTVTEESPVDIEAGANAFFHQMFSGQLSIEAVVQMLARFKESSERREQLIFEHMIANLFEEYKFFPKYPDKQLKLAAVLFGSLIKNQLVTHLALGIALRGVLDALRKSVDSKMFVFGTKALEQFMDRLVEWPQYCNHILQISHLRGTHSELVSFIEQTLAHISLCQSESNGSSTFPVDQQHDSPATSVENMEALESSWQLISPSSAQLGQQVSPFQLQQKHQAFLTESLKTTAASASYSLPHFSHAGRSFVVSAPVDSVASHTINASQSLQAPFPQQSASITSGVSSSPGFLRSSSSIIPAGTPRQPLYNIGFGAALNIETLVAAAEQRHNQIEAPASEVQDKISFMINNISNANMDAKGKDFTEVLKVQYYPWFAQYMVMKRASIEPNFHDVYLKFLDKVNSKPLNKEIVKATYENCKALLRSDLIKSSSEERSLLRNLGSWLGKFTIGRNQALLAKEIDPKVLIVEAYEKGLMIAVIPFTSKILEPCQCSLAYRPPSPWTMGILGLLVEIYNLPNLKLNLKFDIEVLFKNLVIDMKTVIPTSLLKDRIREVEGNPDFSNKEPTSSQPQVIAELNSGIIPSASQLELQPEVNTSHSARHPNVPTQHTGPLHLPPNAVVEDDKSLPLVIPERVPSAQSLPQVAPSPTSLSLNQLLNTSNYDSYININPKLSSIGSQRQFHRIVQLAMDRAIAEIVSPVIQRSVTIASRTTKELVLKDYALESDYSVISRHARLMVGALAGSIAHVTCKEPLRVALSNHLRSFLQNLNVTSEGDQIAQILTTDHLDLGCAVIEDAASEKAVLLIDGEISQSLKQRELGDSAYYAAATYAQGPFALVPEALRPKPGRLSVAQQQVYEDFIQKLSPSQPSQNANVLPAGPPGMGGSLVNSSVPRVYGSGSGQSNSSMFSAPQGASGFSSVAQQFDQIPDDSDCHSGQHLSASSANIGTNDGGIQFRAETNHIASTFPVVTSSELHLVDSATGTKEPGAVAPLLTATSGTEHIAVSEPLLTTGDALEKYQHVEQMVSHFFDEWCRICDLPATANTTYSHYISQFQQNGWVKGDDVTEWVFCFLTMLSVARCVPADQGITPSSLSLQSTQQLQNLSYYPVDAYAKLVALVLKYCSFDQGSDKAFLLTKILSVTVRVIQKDAEDKKTSFNPRPYFRLFINWLLDLSSPDLVPDDSNFQVLTSFANAFHALQPLKVPGWSFAWLELVSHRSFMPKLLTINSPKGWPFFQRLLVDLFIFMEPYLRSAELGEPVRFLYKGTLRVLLVLVHDFPEFLCDYHFSFCDVIPPSCIQMRNVILSAFPRNMKLPDPSTPNLKIDLLAEISQTPRIFSDVDGALKVKQIKHDLDEYLKTRPEGSTFLTGLKQRLLLPQNEASLTGTRYNVPLINSLVLYIGMQAIQQLQSKSTSQHAPAQQMSRTPMDIFLVDEAMDIFQSLIKSLDMEGRYLFLNAVANQLRYPNNHTHYFSFVLLYLFAEVSQDIIQEQITRVLLERLIVNRPHPWGLLITFIELIKNPRYNFWNRAFTRCAPEIENIFEFVSRFCGGPKTVDGGIVTGGIPAGNH